MKTLLVMSGGNLNGGFHAGVLQGLADQGIEPDVMLGVSTGALAVAYCASGEWRSRVDQYADVWHALRSVAELRAGGIPRGLWRAITGKPSLGTFAPLRALLRTQLQPIERQAFVGVTSLSTGEFFMKRPTADFVEASCSVPPATAPVPIGGDWWVDGGVRHVCPVGPAFDLARMYGWPSESFRIIASVAGGLPAADGALEDTAWSGGNLLATVERVVDVLESSNSSGDLDRSLEINDLVRAGAAKPGMLSAPITVLRNPMLGHSWTLDPVLIANQIAQGRILGKTVTA